MSPKNRYDQSKGPESWFGSFEDEHAIAAHVGVLRLMKGIASSTVIQSTVENDKTIESFVLRLCRQCYKDPKQLQPLVKRWVSVAHVNKDQQEAMRVLGMLQKTGVAAEPFAIHKLFEEALLLEYDDSALTEEIKINSGFIRHDRNQDELAAYYLSYIEEEKLKGFNILNALETSKQSIGFYVGLYDPLFC